MLKILSIMGKRIGFMIIGVIACGIIVIYFLPLFGAFIALLTIAWMLVESFLSALVSHPIQTVVASLHVLVFFVLDALFVIAMMAMCYAWTQFINPENATFNLLRAIHIETQSGE